MSGQKIIKYSCFLMITHYLSESMVSKWQQLLYSLKQHTWQNFCAGFGHQPSGPNHLHLQMGFAICNSELDFTETGRPKNLTSNQLRRTEPINEIPKLSIRPDSYRWWKPPKNKTYPKWMSWFFCIAYMHAEFIWHPLKTPTQMSSQQSPSCRVLGVCRGYAVHITANHCAGYNKM